MKPWALEMGGRYQKDHASFSGWTLAAREEEDADAAEALFSAMGAMLEEVEEPLETMGLADASFATVVVVLDPTEPRAAESNGLPPDLGVLAEPNDAKAPDPRPNALDAPLVGDTRPPTGVLKWLDLEPSPPWRFDKEVPLRGESCADEPLAPIDVASESLPLLYVQGQKL